MKKFIIPLPDQWRSGIPVNRFALRLFWIRNTSGNISITMIWKGDDYTTRKPKISMLGTSTFAMKTLYLIFEKQADFRLSLTNEFLAHPKMIKAHKKWNQLI